MLEGVVASKTRVRVLVKLFLNPDTKAYLRELATEFSLSTNAVRTELNRLKAHGLVLAERNGRNVFYRANTGHPLFPELASMVRKITGIDALVGSVVEPLENLEDAYVTGDYARGLDTGVIDVVLVGRVDEGRLTDAVHRTETRIGRKIRSLVLTREEFEGLVDKRVIKAVLRLWGPASRRCTNA